ncbi:hypothetical protein [Prosthecobacter sp.]|uniref:hypothetical protein n=1 Tax=Prosthecobacter sp. TaxID=1965333 RepID=UPI001DC3E8F4|nr:hypothetical protein [Prosthecobacter sp.]MCB1275313.1 hypothetical protein [Prosthecobacter sp.]
MRLPSFKLILWAVLLVTAINAGPGALHTIYRYVTPDAEIEAMREEYEELADSERTLDPEERPASIRRRLHLHLWFHVRGLNIDEDDAEHSMWHPWGEFIDYWTMPTE